MSRLRAVLRARPDSEHEISINRIAMTAIIYLCWRVADVLGYEPAKQTIAQATPLIGVFIAAGLCLFLHLLYRPGVSHARRIAAMFADFAFLSCALYVGDDALALLYPIYMWAILGNGFRYGLTYLVAAAVIAVASFLVVVLTTEFWRAHVALSVGLILGLIVIPAYTATLIRKLSAATHAAEAASHSKSMFLASVSHELRTPLNAIVGLSDLLIESPLDTEQSDMVRTIGRSGRSLASLINAILDVSRMEIGQQKVKTEAIDLCELLAGVRDMLAVQANAKSVRMTVYMAPDAPRHIVASRSHLEEILINLGGNAVKFTRDGYVQISVELLPGPDETPLLRFEVRDTGIGIPENARERIFERFSQADETIIDRYGGTGLGLSIVKQLVEGGGGRIGVKSEVGVGSTFWFEMSCAIGGAPEELALAAPIFVVSPDRRVHAEFKTACARVECFDLFADVVARLESDTALKALTPVIVFDAQSVGPDFETAIAWFTVNAALGRWPLVWLRGLDEAMPSPSLIGNVSSSIRRPVTATQIEASARIALSLGVNERPRRVKTSAVFAPLDILVAEDNRTNQLVIRKILENAGHGVTLVENGEQALESLSKHKFDLVLLDVNMPVLNGIETAKLARFIEIDREKTPLVALTADATRETQERCLEAGMDDCLTKPIENAQLLAWLARFQEGRAARTVEVKEEKPHPDGEQPSHDAGQSGSIDQRALDDLKALGGKEFVDQIVGQFVQDAAGVLRDLSKAVAQGDAHAFREHAHALRSCAANVGARKVYDLCLEWRAIDAGEVAMRGEAHMRELEIEFEKARASLVNN